MSMAGEGDDFDDEYFKKIQLQKEERERVQKEKEYKRRQKINNFSKQVPGEKVEKNVDPKEQESEDILQVTAPIEEDNDGDYGEIPRNSLEYEDVSSDEEEDDTAVEEKKLSEHEDETDNEDIGSRDNKFSERPLNKQTSRKTTVKKIKNHIPDKLGQSSTHKTPECPIPRLMDQNFNYFNSETKTVHNGQSRENHHVNSQRKKEIAFPTEKKSASDKNETKSTYPSSTGTKQMPADTRRISIDEYRQREPDRNKNVSAPTKRKASLPTDSKSGDMSKYKIPKLFGGKGMNREDCNKIATARQQSRETVTSPKKKRTALSTENRLDNFNFGKHKIQKTFARKEVNREDPNKVATARRPSRGNVTTPEKKITARSTENRSGAKNCANQSPKESPQATKSLSESAILEKLLKREREGRKTPMSPEFEKTILNYATDNMANKGVSKNCANQSPKKPTILEQLLKRRREGRKTPMSPELEEQILRYALRNRADKSKLKSSSLGITSL